MQLVSANNQTETSGVLPVRSPGLTVNQLLKRHHEFNSHHSHQVLSVRTSSGNQPVCGAVVRQHCETTLGGVADLTGKFLASVGAHRMYRCRGEAAALDQLDTPERRGTFLDR
jgi:hypothetical protein